MAKAHEAPNRAILGRPVANPPAPRNEAHAAERGRSGLPDTGIFPTSGNTGAGHADLTPSRTWLDWQCRMISGVVEAAILGPTPDGDDWMAVATWPSESTPDHRMRKLATKAVAEERRLLYQPRRDRGGADDEDLIACPLVNAPDASGAVVLRLKPRNDLQLRAVANLLEWGLHWLTTAAASSSSADKAHGDEFAAVMSAALSAPDLTGAVQVLCEWAAGAQGYDRVSIGLRRGLGVRFIGTRAGLDTASGSTLASDLEAAMTEAVDHDLPGPYPQAGLPDLAHRKLLQRHGMARAESWLLRHGDTIIGVLTGESAAGTGSSSADQLSPWLPAAASAISLLHRRERMLSVRLARRLPATHRGRWIAGGLLTGVLMFGAWPVTLQVTSQAGVEGREQRAIVAPIDGYLASASARAGDDVRRGDLLATLDDHDLQLERTRWASETERHSGDYTDALTRRDRATASAARNRMMQAQAELDLAEQRLERTRLRAPFDGVVVHGDFSQLLGTPIERGQVLFEVAPISRYHVIARVDEKDIGHLSAGSIGRLRLSALPQTEFPLVVSRIEPVATAQDGQNLFRVEATFEEDAPLIRPGMAGIAQFEAGTAPLAWSWLRSTVAGVRLWFWRLGIF